MTDFQPLLAVSRPTAIPSYQTLGLIYVEPKDGFSVIHLKYVVVLLWYENQKKNVIL